MDGYTFIFLSLAVFGGYVGSKLRFPGAVVVGALLFSSFGNLMALPHVVLPPFYKFGIQVVAGCMVGSAITRETIHDIRLIALPILVNGCLIIVGSIVVAIIVSSISGWDIVTTWLAASPGRMADMIIYSGTIGGDTSKVAMTHVLRMLAVLLVMPLAVKIYGARLPKLTVQPPLDSDKNIPDNPEKRG